MKKSIMLDGEILCHEGMHGLHRYAFEIISRLNKIIQNHKVKIRLMIPKGETLYIDLENIEVVQYDVGKSKISRISSKLKQIGSVKFSDAVYCNMTNGYVRGLKNSILTLHDLIPLSPVAEFDGDYRDKMQNQYHSMLKYAQKVVTVSETSKREISEKLNYPANKIKVIGNGWEHMKNIKADNTVFYVNKKIVPGRYYYAIGNQFKYKNFKWIQEVAKRNPDNYFVICGGGDWYKGVDYNLPNMIYLGVVPDETHKALLSSCKGFLHPSKLEGFGIPPLEALSCDRKVAVANASCLPEIYGNSVVYFNPDDYNVDIDKLFSTPVDKPDAVLKKYTWENAAKSWIELFEEFLQK